jgi:pimeloyl-ACP methyl ester carboxylesterase
MDTIRQALGETQLNYLGISYGTLLGLRYATLFPHNARAIALDGVVDPKQDFSEFLRQQTIAFDSQITHVLDACPSGANCPPGGASAAYDEVARRVETAPIPGKNGRLLGPSELAVAVLIPTYDTSATTIFYQGLTSALQGDGAPLLRVADAYYGAADFPLYAAVECTDSPHPVGAEAYEVFAKELEAISPRIGGGIANELLPCAFWPAPVKDITGPVTAPDSPPILVVGNTRDAATPYQQAVDVANTLVNGHLLTFDSAGHAAYGQSACVDKAEQAYFVDLTLPSEGATCSD